MRKEVKEQVDASEKQSLLRSSSNEANKSSISQQYSPEPSTDDEEDSDVSISSSRSGRSNGDIEDENSSDGDSLPNSNSGGVVDSTPGTVSSGQEREKADLTKRCSEAIRSPGGSVSVDTKQVNKGSLKKEELTEEQRYLELMKDLQNCTSQVVKQIQKRDKKKEGFDAQKILTDISNSIKEFDRLMRKRNTFIGKKLPKAAEIHLKFLQNAIDALRIQAANGSLDPKVIKLIQEVVSGKSIVDIFEQSESKESQTEPATDTSKESKAISAGLAAIMEQAREGYENYKNYTSQTRLAFKDILSEYKGYLDNPEEKLTRGVKIRRYWSPLRLRRQYFYAGKHQDQRNFIYLIDRLALMDGEYVNQLQKALADCKDFNYENQISFLNRIYDIFEEIQERYYDALKKKREDVIEELYKCYYDADGALDAAIVGIDVNSENTKKNLEAYFDVLLEINNSRDIDDEAIKKVLKILEKHLLPNQDQLLEKIRSELSINPYQNLRDILKRDLLRGFKTPGKLTYDINAITADLWAERDDADAQIKQLRRDVSHVAEDLCVPVKIAKQKNPTRLFDEVPYEITETDEFEFVSDKRKKARLINHVCWGIAIVSGLLLGTGEGFAACYGFEGSSMIHAIGLTAQIILPIAIVVLIAGFISNYLLCCDDTYDTSRKFARNKIFVDEKKKPISRLGIALTVVFGVVVSLFAGANYGVISFDAFNAIVALGTAGSVISGVIGAFTFIGLGSVYFVALVDFCVNKRWRDAYAFLKKTFGAPWSELTDREKLNHICHCAFEVLKILVTIGIMALILGFGGPLFAAHMTKTFGVVYAGIGWAANNFCALVFGVKKISKQMERVTAVDALLFVPKLVVGVIAFPFALLTRGFDFIFGTNSNKWVQAVARVPIDYLERKCERWVNKTYSGVDKKLTRKVAEKPAGEELSWWQKIKAWVKKVSEADKHLNPLQKCAKDQAEITSGVCAESVKWNGLGQALLYASAGDVVSKVGLSPVVGQASAAIAEYPYSSVPNKSAADATLKKTEIVPAPGKASPSATVSMGADSSTKAARDSSASQPDLSIEPARLSSPDLIASSCASSSEAVVTESAGSLSVPEDKLGSPRSRLLSSEKKPLLVSVSVSEGVQSESASLGSKGASLFGRRRSRKAESPGRASPSGKSTTASSFWFSPPEEETKSKLRDLSQQQLTAHA